jgi:hypothetical protein
MFFELIFLMLNVMFEIKINFSFEYIDWNRIVQNEITLNVNVEENNMLKNKNFELNFFLMYINDQNNTNVNEDIEHLITNDEDDNLFHE